jgi:hypothetical protein
VHVTSPQTTVPWDKIRTVRDLLDTRIEFADKEQVVAAVNIWSRLAHNPVVTRCAEKLVEMDFFAFSEVNRVFESLEATIGTDEFDADSTASDLLQVAENFLVGLSHESYRLRESLPEELAPNIESLRAALRIEKIVSRAMGQAVKSTARIEEAAESAETSATHAMTAAGRSGDASISKHFDDYSKAQHVRALCYRMFALVLAAGGIGLALFFLSQSQLHQWGVQQLTFRTLILLGITGVTTFIARLGGQHREQGVWAATLAVQLKSFAAYVDTMSNRDQADDLFVTFANRVFGAPPQVKDKNEGLQISLQDLLNLLPNRQ